MEKILNDLTKTWTTMEFTYEVHESTKTPLLKSSEELIETLEDNQVMLQNMMTSKVSAFKVLVVEGMFPTPICLSSILVCSTFRDTNQ